MLELFVLLPLEQLPHHYLLLTWHDVLLSRGGGRILAPNDSTFVLTLSWNAVPGLACRATQAAKEAAAATVTQGKHRALTAGKKMAEARAERECVANPH